MAGRVILHGPRKSVSLSGRFRPVRKCKCRREGLLQAVADKDTFAVAGHRYRVLVVPFGVVLPGKVYEKIMANARIGVPVVFFGPPPAFAAETGQDIAAKFAESVGFKAFTLAEYETLRKQWESSRDRFRLPGVANFRQSRAGSRRTNHRRSFDDHAAVLYAGALILGKIW